MRVEIFPIEVTLTAMLHKANRRGTGYQGQQLPILVFFSQLAKNTWQIFIEVTLSLKYEKQQVSGFHTILPAYKHF